MLRYCTIFLSLLFAIHLQAQEETALRIGNRVPNTVIGHYIDKPAEELKLYDQKASLLLLDFWSSGCGTCLRSIPVLDSLQRRFAGRIKIITITKEKPATIRTMFSKLKLPFTTEGIVQADSGFLRLFPYNSVPHHVWLDSTFRIQYITTGSNATAPNISSFLKGIHMPFEEKYEFIKYDLSTPQLKQGGGRLYDSLRYCSYIMPYIQGYNGLIGRIIDTKRGIYGFKAYNQPLLSIIKSAWERFPTETFENNNRVVLEIKDSTPFLQPADRNQYYSWCRKNVYSYELRLPAEKKDEVFPVMQQDLLRYFDYDISIEKREIPCLVLVRTSEEDKIGGKGIPPRSGSDTNGGKDTIRFRSIDLDGFVANLKSQYRNLKTPFLNETGYSGSVDLWLRGWPREIDTLNKELERFDLTLLAEKRQLEVLVIKDKKKGGF